MSTEMEIDAILADGTSGEEPPEIPGASWDDVGLAATVAGVIDGTLVRPVPTIGCMDGTTRGLFYPGKVHDLHGVAGGGKSYLAAYAVAQEIDRGEHVVWVDLEDDEQTLVRRLLDLGCTGADIVERLHYKKPLETSFLGISYLWSTVEAYKPTLVVVDSTGESMGMDGVKGNEDGEVASWMRRVARSTADLGPAVVLLDHVPKADEMALMSIGSQRKSAGMNGAIYSMQAVTAFSRDTTGFAKIVCGKDRSGDYAKGSVVAEFHYDAPSKTFSLRIPVPVLVSDDGGVRPTFLMEKVSRFVEINPACSQKTITDGLSYKRANVIRAIQVLHAEGFLATSPGQRNSLLHSMAFPYRDGDAARPATDDLDVDSLLGD